MKKTRSLLHWTGLRKYSIRKRLNYSIAFLVLVPIIMIIVLTHVIFGNAMKHNIQTYSEQLTDQLGKNMENEIKWLIECSMELVYSDSFQSMVQNQDKTDWDFLSNYRLVTNACSTKFGSKDYIEQAEYCISQDKVYTLLGEEGREAQEQAWAVVEENTGQVTPYYWYYPENIDGEKPALYLVIRVRKLAQGMVKGFMVIGLNENFLKDLYSDMEESLGQGTEIFTLNDQGALILKKSLTDLKQLPDVCFGQDRGSMDFKLNDKNYLGIWNCIPTTGWFVFAMIPYAYINSVSNSTSVLILLIGLAVLALGFTITAVINMSIVIPLNRILDYTVSLRLGEFDQEIQDDGEDEIRQLADAFNCTTAEVNRLMQNVQEQSEQKARLEFDALQAQINPHFLANTLNTISYLAQLRGMENIENIAHALTNILMVSMGKESKIITIEKEISYVKDYLLIQSYRYSDLYEVKFEIPDELLQRQIPKFVLQPIVENAIVHGVSCLEDGRGLVVIHGEFRDGDIHICVSDNGPGISEKLQEELLNGEESPRGMCGLGVKSVNQRLKLLYGEQYGIVIASRPGNTMVELVFPADGGEGNEDNSDS